jgi:transcriptional regulator with XRE-family HTH domain
MRRQNVAKFTSRNFHQLIRGRRRQLDLTQEEVASRIKTSVAYVGHLESGKRHASPTIVMKLADILGLDRSELFFLANPVAKTLVSEPPGAKGPTAWDRFREDRSLREAHRITEDELNLLSHMALMGNVRSSRDFIFVLNTIRQSLAPED